MWAQGNQWNMPLDAAAYQNMNHELVDWASLAQQWIRMKEVHETVVLNVPEVTQSHFSSNLNVLRSLQLPGIEVQPSESGVTSGEAPMDVEKEDEVVSSVPDWSWTRSNQPTQSWQPQHATLARHAFPQVLHPGSTNLPTILGPTQVIHAGDTNLPQTIGPSHQTFHSGVPPSLNFPPRVPLLPLPSKPTSSDEDSLGASSFNVMPTLDATKRKNLPAWIREGLEKMEKEKQRKEQREKFLLERELKRKKDLELRGEKDLAIPRSRFDSDEDDSDETPSQSCLKQSSATEVVSNTQAIENIMVRIRQIMTEILLEVTTEEIRSAALEASQRAKVKNRQAQSPLSSKSLTRKLIGLDQYGSDSDDNEDSDQEAVRISGLGDSKVDSFSVKNLEKQQQIEEIRLERDRTRNSQVEKDSGKSEKLSHSIESEQIQNKRESKVLQDGTKVETDITCKIPHGQDQSKTHLNNVQQEESTVENVEIADSKYEISGVGKDMSSKSRDQSSTGGVRMSRRSRTPERRKRSRSRDIRYSDRRSREHRRSKSRRRTRSRDRKRSHSRRRSRSRDRKRRSRSSDRKVSRKGK